METEATSYRRCFVCQECRPIGREFLMPRLLEQWSTVDLQAELRRRALGFPKDKRPIVNCEECAHFVAYDGPKDQDVPDDYNPCAKGHAMAFRVPPDDADPHAAGWGFYRRGCRDRVNAETPAGIAIIRSRDTQNAITQKPSPTA